MSGRVSPPLFKTCPCGNIGDDTTGRCATCADTIGKPEKSPLAFKIKPRTIKVKNPEGAPVAEVKKSEPPVEQAMPIPEQTIHLTKALGNSDTANTPVRVSEVEAFLRKANPKKGDFWFEATNPGRVVGASRDASDVKNRVYVDIDGGAFLEYGCAYQTDEWLEEKQAAILKCFKDNITEPHSVMTATKRLPNNSIKLSFRITYTQLHGTKAEVEKYVMWGLLPKYREWLKDIIACDAKENQYVKRFNEAKKRQENVPPDYPHLTIDKSVYDVGRKMRCWNCVKDEKPENISRPNVLVEGSVLDTLITFIPPESQPLVVPPEPSKVKSRTAKPEKVAPRQVEEMSVAETTTTTGDPMADDTDQEERHTLVKEVLDNLSDMRADDYDCWMRVGFILFNIGMSCDDWVEFSKRSSKFKDGECEKRWASMKRGALREATLWKWLREDNTPAYDELSKERTDFWSLVANASHAEVAHFFYNLRPNSYLWHPELKWYQLQPTGIWLHFDKEPAGLMNDIWETFKPIIVEHLRILNEQKPEPETEEGKRHAKRQKAALNFLRMSGDSRFAKGVLDYLPYNYYVPDLPDKMDESHDLLAFSDCVWDFNKRAIRPIKPEDYICLNTGYAFPEEPSEEAVDAVMTFLRGIFEPDDYIRENDDPMALTAYVLRILADKLHGRRRFQDFYLMSGLGGNGKGLLRNLLQRVFGRYYQEITHQVLTKTQEKQNSHSPEMSQAKGKRLLMATEPDASDHIQVSIVKAYTGGDQITARPPYGTKPVIYKGQFGLFLQCNMKPKLSKADGGVQRRLRVIKFPFQFKQPHDIDPTNPFHKPSDAGVEEDTLRNNEWRDAFLHILLKAYYTIGESLNPPPEVLEASEEYMDENNPVKSWFKDNFRVVADKTDMRFWLGASEIHSLWDMTNPKRGISDSALKNFLEVGCGLSQTKTKHDKVASHWALGTTSESGVVVQSLTAENGSWEDKTLRAGKYWLGVVPIGASNPDGGEW